MVARWEFGFEPALAPDSEVYEYLAGVRHGSLGTVIPPHAVVDVQTGVKLLAAIPMPDSTVQIEIDDLTASLHEYGGNSQMCALPQASCLVCHLDCRAAMSKRTTPGSWRGDAAAC